MPIIPSFNRSNDQAFGDTSALHGKDISATFWASVGVMPLSWCDKLASTPGIGVRLSPHFASGDSIIDGLSPVLRPLTEATTADLEFAVEQVQPFGLRFTTNGGFTYDVDHRRFFVGFNHRIRAEMGNAGPPTMKMLSEPAPYTELLPIVVDRVVEGIALLNANSDRTFTRIGVMATTHVVREDMPPGINAWIEYLGRPWVGGLNHMTSNIFGNLEDTDDWSDRCGHQLTLPEDQSKLLQIVLDYQRTFKVSVKFTEEKLRQLSRKVSEDALKYFEKVAEGSMFDEQIIGDGAA